jgi:hypothetical protein
MEERKTQKYINVVSGKDGSQSEGRGLEWNIDRHRGAN